MPIKKLLRKNPQLTVERMPDEAGHNNDGNGPTLEGHIFLPKADRQYNGRAMLEHNVPFSTILIAQTKKCSSNTQTSSMIALTSFAFGMVTTVVMKDASARETDTPASRTTRYGDVDVQSRLVFEEKSDCLPLFLWQ